MKTHTTQDYVKGILAGDRFILSRAITLIESTHPEHEAQSFEVIEQCLPHAGQSIRIGITGVPGVGKSTFIESFGQLIVEQGHRLAVLAIDPSSQYSKGSILGDKTRMVELSRHERAYIRPSPTSGSLGGVARRTRETILLFEAAGFDVIIVETVGVGQSETLVHSMVDFFLLLMLAGAGDELQGIKRGIMEMADALVITKADGDNVAHAKQARAEYAGALHLFPPQAQGWIPPVLTCSAVEKKGLSEIWQQVMSFKEKMQSNGAFEKNRQDQARTWMFEAIEDALKTHFEQHPQVKALMQKLEPQVLAGTMSPFHAARLLMDTYRVVQQDDKKI